jgi:hypothetical protein
MGRTSLFHIALALLGGLAIISAFALAPAAQFGEQGGQPHFQVQVGHNQTFQWVLLNEGNSSIGFQIQIESIAAQGNQTTPTITASPMHGVIPAGGSFVVNLTVSMPLNDTPNAVTWSTIASAVEASNVSNPGGAVLQAGVAKIVSIAAIPSTTTTSTIPQRAVGAPISVSSSTLIIASVGIAIVAGIAGGLYYTLRKKPVKRKAVRKRKAPAKKAKKKATGRKPARRRRAPARSSRPRRRAARKR